MKRSPVCVSVWLLPLVVLIFVSCASTKPALDENAGIEKKGLFVASRFFVLKGGDGENINNVTFKRYATLLTDRLHQGGWIPESYGKADTFLLLEYGENSFYEKNVTIEPEYDRETNKTVWVHKGAEIKSKPYLRIKGINAEDYRVEGKETVTFTLLVTYPETESLDQQLIEKLVEVGTKSML